MRRLLSGSVSNMTTDVPNDIADARSLLMLITVIASGGNEDSCARLLATGIPSLIPSADCWIALKQIESTDWQAIIDHEGQAFSDAATQDFQAGLQRLFEATQQRGAPLLLDNGKSSEEPLPDFLAQGDRRQVAIVPLATLRNPLGILIAARNDDASFTPGDISLLETIAQHAAVAMENCRLTTSLKRHNEQLHGLVERRTQQLRHSESRQRALLEINNAIVANLGRDPLFQAVAQSLQNAVRYDRVSLVLKDDDKEELRVYGLAGSGIRQFAPVGSVLPPGAGFVEEALTTERPHIRTDLAIGPRKPIEQSLFDDGHRSYVIVPLISQTRIVGTLNLASNQPGAFSNADGEFLLEVGKQVALAIENMFAYERIDDLQRQLALENEYLREQESHAGGFGEIIGQSDGLQKALEQAKLVAPTDASVIILGESGTGKELIARAVHQMSGRREGPLIRVNCAAVPHELFESEFFGHAKGAFTGAVKQRVGRFELADRGTLFLDEVGEIPLDLQSKLLRVLQEGTFERVGEERTRQVDVRVIAATNRDLAAEIKKGTFREDLYYRLSVFPVDLPPLRDRRQDIPLLAKHFADLASARHGRRRLSIGASDLARLAQYDWPGNIRELQNVIERAVIVSKGGELDLAVWMTDNVKPARESSLLLQDIERNHIVVVLEMSGWRVSGQDGAAERLGLKPTTLEARMKKLGIARPSR